MSYPGDSSLYGEIQIRVTDTFAQTLDLAVEGKRVEALLGCDFMLRLDPLFEPARALQDNLQEEAPIAREELRRAAGLPDGAEPGSGNGSSLAADLEPSPARAELDGTDPIEEPVEEPPDPRILSLLEEGESELEAGRFQKAIDAWSRISLIDTENEEANRRIEEAQKLKAEHERKIEETFSGASDLLDQGDEEAALTTFQAVLDLDPEHLAARDQIDGIRAPKSDPGGDTTLHGEARAEENRPRVPLTPGRVFRGTPPPAPRQTSVPKRTNTRFIAIGSLVLVLVVAGAWVLNSNWNRLFPNAEEEPAATPQRRPVDRIARITTLYESGGSDEAIEALETIEPDSADYDRAQLLLAQWRGETEPDVPLVEGEASEVAAQREFVQQARLTYELDEYLTSARLFMRATAIRPLEGADADLFDDAKRQLEPLAPMIDLYNQREYEIALPSLWTFYEENPDSRDARRLLVNSQYNMAVQSLRRRQPEAAEALLREAVRLDSDDAFAQRLLLFSQTYTRTSRDLLYEIFVENLEFRR